MYYPFFFPVFSIVDTDDLTTSIIKSTKYLYVCSLLMDNNAVYCKLDYKDVSYLDVSHFTDTFSILFPLSIGIQKEIKFKKFK